MHICIYIYTYRHKLYTYTHTHTPTHKHKQKYKYTIIHFRKTDTRRHRHMHAHTHTRKSCGCRRWCSPQHNKPKCKQCVRPQQRHLNKPYKHLVKKNQFLASKTDTLPRPEMFTFWQWCNNDCCTDMCPRHVTHEARSCITKWSWTIGPKHSKIMTCSWLCRHHVRTRQNLF